MKEEDLIKKLKNLDLPSADLEDHRRQLRAALLASGSRPKPSRAGILRSTVSRVRIRADALAAHLKSPQRVQRLAALGTVAIVLIVGFLVLRPFLDGQSPTTQAKDIARNSPQVKEALGGEDSRVLRVIKEGTTSTVILERAGENPGSGSRIVVSVDMNTGAVTSALVGGGSSSLQTSGTSSHVLVSKLTNDGADVVFLGAEGGLYAISKGKLLWSAPFAGEPEAVIDDVTGDGSRDVVTSGGSCVRCYDGITGEKVWQFECGQRRVFQENLGWGGEDLYVWSIEVLGSQTSQIISVQSDWHVFGIDARDGKELWQFKSLERVRTMATVPDRDGDGTDELLQGTYEGNLYLVNGSAGRVEWRRDIGKEWVEYGEVQHGRIESIAVFDDQGSQAIISVGDGRVCLVDLEDGDIEWENEVTYRELSESVDAWLVPDVTGDGQPEVLANKGYISEIIETTTRPDGSSSQFTSRALRIVALLSGADGSEVWTSEVYANGSAMVSMDGNPVLVEPNPELGIRLVGLRDGQTQGSVRVSPLGGKASEIELMSDGYLVLTKDGGLVAISPAGEVQWCYSRLSSITVAKGLFTSDAIPDLLVCGESAEASGVRQVSALDGVTWKDIWCYEVPWTDSATVGGLGGVQVVDDLTGDGIQDVIAYRGSRVFRFSGSDGSLAEFDTGESIACLQPTRTGPGATAILVGTEDGLVILDRAGTSIWKSAYTDWSAAELMAVRVLNDLNQDGVSDLVLSFADRLLVAKSVGSSPPAFDTLRLILATDNKVIELKELTNDIDGDGVQEIAYYEYDRDKSAASGVLLVVSPVSGQVCHQWTMPVTVDLACADFNGDGCRDSLLHRQEAKQQQATSSTHHGLVYPRSNLEVYSGKDNSVLWTHSFDENWWNTDSEKMPAAPVGDITGDGIEDLAVSSVTSITTVGYSFSGSSARHETRVSVFDVANGALVKEVTLPPAQKDSDVAWDESHGAAPEPVSGPGDAMRLAGDLNGDGHQELAVLASYDMWSAIEHRLALVDLQNEEILGYSNMLSTLDFFEANENYTVGFTSKGSVCLAKVSNGLHVTWPSEGATVGSHARIAWEGEAAPSSMSVFVDGYENAQTTGNEITLLLKPGEHEVIVRSTDEYGIVTYAAVHFRVEDGLPWTSILAGVSAMALLSIYFAARVAKVMRNRRARREGL